MANEFIARNGLIAQNNSVITGSLIVTAGITGSLQGTATSASYAPAGGSNSHIQFNDSGSFGGESFLFYNKDLDAFGNGRNVIVNGNFSHAEGRGTTTNGEASHAEGVNSETYGEYSHAEGGQTYTYGRYSHAEGSSTIAIGFNSHAEGETSKTGENAYSCSINAGVVEIDASQGDLTSTYSDGVLIYFGDVSLPGLQITRGIVTGSSFNGTNTVFQLLNTSTTIASAGIIDSSGNLSNQLGGNSAHAEGNSSFALGLASHAEGYSTITYGNYSHAEGENSITYGDYSHAEGYSAAYGNNSHAEGGGTAYAAYSHAEGAKTTSGYNAFQSNNIASGVITFPNYYGDLSATFAPGTIIYVNDETQQAVQTHEVASVTVNGGGETEVTLVDTTYDPQNGWRVGIKGTANPTYADSYIGEASHAEGDSTITLGINSHAAGWYTIAHGYYQSVVGQFNAPVESPSTFVIGDGTEPENRHNLLVAGNGSVGITGSFVVRDTAAALSIDSENRILYDENENPSVAWSTQRTLEHDNGTVVDWANQTLNDYTTLLSVDWDNRQLVKSDGTTVTLDWETGAMTGSFTGSFVGDGSGLTGVGATEYIRRSDYTGSLDPNVNYLYTGYAPVGSAESATVWTLSRLAISSSGATITQVTASAAWTNRYSYTYL
jgi:hypothetical protein